MLIQRPIEVGGGKDKLVAHELESRSGGGGGAPAAAPAAAAAAPVLISVLSEMTRSVP